MKKIWEYPLFKGTWILLTELKLKRQGKWRTPQSRVYQDVSSLVQGRGQLNSRSGDKSIRLSEPEDIGFYDPDKQSGCEALLTTKKQGLNSSFLTRLAANLALSE